jgi:hypothetical protein
MLGQVSSLIHCSVKKLFLATYRLTAHEISEEQCRPQHNQSITTRTAQISDESTMHKAVNQQNGCTRAEINRIEQRESSGYHYFPSAAPAAARVARPRQCHGQHQQRGEEPTLPRAGAHREVHYRPAPGAIERQRRHWSLEV